MYMAFMPTNHDRLFRDRQVFTYCYYIVLPMGSAWSVYYWSRRVVIIAYMGSAYYWSSNYVLPVTTGDMLLLLLAASAHTSTLHFRTIYLELLVGLLRKLVHNTFSVFRGSRCALLGKCTLTYFGSVLKLKYFFDIHLRTISQELLVWLSSYFAHMWQHIQRSRCAFWSNCTLTYFWFSTVASLDSWHQRWRPEFRSVSL